MSNLQQRLGLAQACYFAGSRPSTDDQNAHWEHVAALDGADVVVAWEGDSSNEWWGDVVYAMNRGKYVVFATAEAVASHQMLWRLNTSHYFRGVESREDAELIARALAAHDPQCKSWHDYCGSDLADLLKSSESPIEARLACFAWGRVQRTFCKLAAQQSVLDGKYRLDFVVSTEAMEALPPEERDCWGYDGRRIRLAIEADGHAFHERTKEQAARDKKRDRELQIAGWTVLRFTGREIWQDPQGCVTQICACLDTLEGNK